MKSKKWVEMLGAGSAVSEAYYKYDERGGRAPATTQIDSFLRFHI
jgi:hypothetical protein